LHNDKIYVVNPDKNPKVYQEFDNKFKGLAGFHTVEFRGQNYFMSGDQSFVVVQLDKDVAVYRHYQRPTDIASGLLKTAQNAVLRHARVLDYQAHVWETSKRSVSFVPPGTSPQRLARRQRNNAEVLRGFGSFIPVIRTQAFKQGINDAFYFAKMKGEDNMLIRVNKDSGEEVERLAVKTDRPIYVIDDVQKIVYFADKKSVQVFELNGKNR
jgi:hypothetical protein